MTITEHFAKAGIDISEKQSEQFQTLFEFMVEYNKNVNLTSITEFDDVIVKHFIDSVLPFKMLGISGNESIIDCD